MEKPEKQQHNFVWDHGGPPDIDADEIDYLEKIGGGCFGDVYRGKCRGKEVAIKKLCRQALDDKTLTDFRKEVQIMSQLRHPNVLLLMGACTTPGYMCLVMELMPKGNLQTTLHDPNIDLSLFRRLQFARETAMGINWLHCSKPQIIHRDIKPSNILLDEHGRVKVCDFGLSAVKEKREKLSDKGSKVIPGTPLWMAPEVLLGKPLDEKADVYSYGMVLWEIITRKEPFETVEDFATLKRMVCTERERPPLPKSIPASLATLVNASWHHDQAKRPSFQEILHYLDHCIVDACVKDETGNKFWKENFLGQDVLPWKTFLPVFAEFLENKGLLKPDDIYAKCLHAILADKRNEAHVGSSESVSVENFGKVLGWFGPLDYSICAKIKKVLEQPWFHGPIDTKQAERLLDGQAPGSFLVRLSTSSFGSFTISKVSKKGNITHQRIEHHGTGTFQVHIPPTGGVGGRDVTGGGQINTFLNSIADELYLREPTPCITYKSLFEASKPTGSYVICDTDDLDVDL